MDPTKAFGPLLGFSLAISFALMAVWLFALLAFFLIPFSLLAMRKQLERLVVGLERIEARLAQFENDRRAPLSPLSPEPERSASAEANSPGLPPP